MQTLMVCLKDGRLIGIACCWHVIRVVHSGDSESFRDANGVFAKSTTGAQGFRIGELDGVALGGSETHVSPHRRKSAKARFADIENEINSSQKNQTVSTLKNAQVDYANRNYELH